VLTLGAVGSILSFKFGAEIGIDILYGGALLNGGLENKNENIVDNP